jgi:CRISPR-associated protein Csh1
MQDRAIAAIGKWQMEKKKNLEQVDLYIENMFPGKDYQILLLLFEIQNNDSNPECTYKGIDIEKVRSDGDGFRKYAYRKGTSGRAGDVTITTKLTIKKLDNIKDKQFSKLINEKDKENSLFEMIYEVFKDNFSNIKNEIKNRYNNFTKQEKESTGISIKITQDDKVLYLNNFNVVRKIIEKEYSKSKKSQDNTESIASNKICSVSNKKEEDVFGFAAPFKFSTFDKPGFISGYFNKEKNWRNYPISSKSALKLELGRRFIRKNLNSRFYGHEYIIVPNPIIKINNKKLETLINLIHTAIINPNVVGQRRSKAEERVMKIIGEQDSNYFYVDLLFFNENKTNKSIKIELMLEEILPSRFRQLFIEVPSTVNKNQIFKNAITIKKEQQDLIFSFQIIRDFFDSDFLDVTNKLFLGKPLSKEYVFEHIMSLIRKKYNDSKTKNGFVEPVHWIVLKAIMLLAYLQQLNIITNNKKYNYMDVEKTQKNEARFNLDRFNEFVKENKSFLDSDIKTGIFAVGVLVRFLFDIQNANLHNTPFEAKLRGYKLNPELLMKVYTEALDKIQKYQNFYTYQELRDIIGKYFVVKFNELKNFSNNELSFYFVAGLELGKEFKREKENN